MVLFHGTTDKHVSSISNRGLSAGSWLAARKSHAFRLAEKTMVRDGGTPVVLEFEVLPENVIRVVGRGLPTYRAVSEVCVPIGVYALVKIDGLYKE